MYMYLQTVFLLVCHGATVLAGTLPELGDCLPPGHTPLVPVTDGIIILLLLLLWTLMLQRRSVEGWGKGDTVEEWSIKSLKSRDSVHDRVFCYLE